MIKIKFPDGNVKEFESGVTGLDIARGISSKLAKEVLSISVNGEIWDLPPDSAVCRRADRCATHQGIVSCS